MNGAGFSSRNFFALVDTELQRLAALERDARNREMDALVDRDEETYQSPIGDEWVIEEGPEEGAAMEGGGQQVDY